MDNSDQPLGLAMPGRTGGAAPLSGRDLALIGGSIVWLVATSVFFLLASGPVDEPDPVRFVLILAFIFFPIAGAVIALALSRRQRALIEENAALRMQVEKMRKAAIVQSQASTGPVRHPVPPPEQTPRFHSGRKTTAAQPPAAEPAQGDPQPSLDLAPGADVPQVSRIDYIIALNFPLDADDQDGFAALRRALRDPRAKRMIQASQDLLTLLSQDGIYMDDLTPDRARPELWRRFAEGERGRTISSLGGIHDRSSLALAAARMREDQIFRDTAHHFLRSFDQSFSAFARDASDEEIVAFAETRTARAFMLMGRVSGIFD